MLLLGVSILQTFVQYPACNSQRLFNRMVYEDYQGTNTYCQQNVSFYLAITEILKLVKKCKKRRKCGQVFIFISFVLILFISILLQHY